MAFRTTVCGIGGVACAYAQDFPQALRVKYFTCSRAKAWVCRWTKLQDMAPSLSPDQESTVTVLLNAGKTVKEISAFAELDRDAVTGIARSLDLEPADRTMKRAKELFASDAGHTYAEVATALASEGLKNDGEPVHYLTIAGWVANQGWAWGGAEDGDYAPERAASTPAKSRFTLRMSRSLDEDVNSGANIVQAADAAWAELDADNTRVVAIAVVKGAAAAGVTDIAAVKASLMERHGEAIRSAKA